MRLSVQLYWSFRSPYSYIVLPRVLALARDYALSVEMRIVHPAALRNPDYFRNMNPLARPYFMLDSSRAAAFQGMPFRRPVQSAGGFVLCFDHGGQPAINADDGEPWVRTFSNFGHESLARISGA